MNKKGGAKYLSPWWFLILVIIAVGIVAGVLIFYSKDVNIKKIEANLLANRIADCLAQKNLAEWEKVDIFKECGLNQNILDSVDYYFEFGVYKSGELIGTMKNYGNDNLKTQCEFRSGGISFTQGEYYARCFELDKESNGYEIKVLAASNQIGKKGKEARNAW